MFAESLTKLGVCGVILCERGAKVLGIKEKYYGIEKKKKRNKLEQSLWQGSTWNVEIITHSLSLGYEVSSLKN